MRSQALHCEVVSAVHMQPECSWLHMVCKGRSHMTIIWCLPVQHVPHIPSDIGMRLHLASWARPGSFDQKARCSVYNVSLLNVECKIGIYVLLSLGMPLQRSLTTTGTGALIQEGPVASPTGPACFLESMSLLAQLHPLWDGLAAVLPVILLSRPAARTLLRLC